MTFAFFTGPGPWLILAAFTVVALWVDLHFFARGREPTWREGVVWSIGTGNLGLPLEPTPGGPAVSVRARKCRYQG